MNSNENPEALHDLAKSKTSPTTPSFVNPGTPASPLVKIEDLENPEVSPAATQMLRDKLTNQ